LFLVMPDHFWFAEFSLRCVSTDSVPVLFILGVGIRYHCSFRYTFRLDPRAFPVLRCFASVGQILAAWYWLHSTDFTCCYSLPGNFLLGFLRAYDPIYDYGTFHHGALGNLAVGSQ
jgi:hypothetical protein